MLDAVTTPDPATSLFAAIAVIVAGAAAKWWFDRHPTRSDRNDAAFDHLMALVQEYQEDREVMRREQAALREELAVVKAELAYSRDDRTDLRHELDACEARHSLLATVMRAHGIDVPEEAG